MITRYRIGRLAALALVVVGVYHCRSKPESYDLILRGGTIVDGSGEPSSVVRAHP